MTDNTIPADKVQEIIEKMKDQTDTPPFDSREEAEQIATRRWQKHLEALLPKPRTLADELRALAAGEERLIDANLHTLADRVEILEQERDDFADRAEELEQERDEARKDAGDAWRGTDKAEAAHAQLIYEKNIREEELAEARVSVEEQAAEIARLRAREIPEGWRIAEHPDYGAVIVDPKEYLDGYVMIRFVNENRFGESRPVPSRILSFRDEAPAPQQQPEHIGPTSCGRYRPYLVEIAGEERVAVRKDNDIVPWVTMSGFDYYSDEDVRVIRALTSEEMDAR